MYRWLCILLFLSASASAQAMPALEDDELQEFIVEHGLFNKLEVMGQSMTDRASGLVVTAIGFLGVPYRRGGNTADTGFDCSGFVRAMYQQTVGLVLPRRAEEQAAATQKIDKQDLQARRPGVLQHHAARLQPRRHLRWRRQVHPFPKPGAEVRVEDMGGSTGSAASTARAAC